MKILVIDGQGGNLGYHVIDRIRKKLGNDITIYACGINALATSTMLKAGANEGATGENAIAYMAKKCDHIIGSIQICTPNGFHGEVSANMALSILNSTSKKFLFPIGTDEIHILGLKKSSVLQQIEEFIFQIEKNIS